METLYASFRVFLGLTAKQATFSFPQVGRKCNTNYKKMCYTPSKSGKVGEPRQSEITWCY